MLEQIEGVLFLDGQRVRPVCLCERCGAERYGPSLRCLRCERREAL